MACPRCGAQQVRKNGRDRRGVQVYECCVCCRSFTPLTATPFSRHHFPPDIIALAVRWYLRYRLSLADIAELLAERGGARAPLNDLPVGAALHAALSGSGTPVSPAR